MKSIRRKHFNIFNYKATQQNIQRRTATTPGQAKTKDKTQTNQLNKRRDREMVLNSGLMVTIANVSANLCQYIACNPERLSSDQVLHLLFCLPLHHFGRLALSFWTYLCYSPTPANLPDSDSDAYSDNDSHSDWWIFLLLFISYNTHFFSCWVLHFMAPLMK